VKVTLTSLGLGMFPVGRLEPCEKRSWQQSEAGDSDLLGADMSVVAEGYDETGFLGPVHSLCEQAPPRKTEAWMRRSSHCYSKVLGGPMTDCEAENSMESMSNEEVEMA